MTMAVASMVSEADKHKLQGHGPDIQTLGATTFNDLVASNEVIPAFALQIGKFTGLLGAPLEDSTLDSPGIKTQALDATSRE